MAKVLIKSARESFRRAGITFTRAGVVVDVDKLDPKQLEAIKNEPNLSVQPHEDGEAAKKADPKKAGK